IAVTTAIIQRGVACTSAITITSPGILKQLGRYTDAELVAAVVSGMFTVFIKTEAPDGPVGESGIPQMQRYSLQDNDCYLTWSQLGLTQQDD
ncbi:phage portal protein, partial [Escherichia coli]|nr:phage portal protein [Escherichia coli]